MSERDERIRAIIEQAIHITEQVPPEQIEYIRDLFEQRGTEVFRDGDVSVAFLLGQDAFMVRITGSVGATLKFTNLEIGGNCLLYPTRIPTSPWVTELPKLERGEWFEIVPGSLGRDFKEGDVIKVELEVDGHPISASFIVPTT